MIVGAFLVDARQAGSSFKDLLVKSYTYAFKTWCRADNKHETNHTIQK